MDLTSAEDFNSLQFAYHEPPTPCRLYSFGYSSYQGRFRQTFIRKFSSVGAMAELGKDVIFVADDGLTGLELWKTDGMPEGTVAVKSFPWQRHMSGSSIQHFTCFQNKLSGGHTMTTMPYIPPTARRRARQKYSRST